MGRESVGVLAMVSAHASVGNTATIRFMKHNATTINAAKDLDATKMVIGAMTMQCLIERVGLGNVTYWIAKITT